MGVSVERLEWRDVPLGVLALPKLPLQLTLGLGSGLSRRPGQPPGQLFAVTDRGPNLFVPDAIDHYGVAGLERLRGERGAKLLPAPELGPEVAQLQVQGGAVQLLRRLPLKTQSGARISGKPLPGADTEGVYDMAGRKFEPDLLGADTEAITVMADGGFMLAEEYGPSLLKADADGVVTERWVAAGRDKDLAHPDLVVRGVLPAKVDRRRANRGFEGLAASEDGAFLYLAVQSSLLGEDERAVPVWKLDARTGGLVKEFRYPFDEPASFRRDAARRKVGWSDLKLCELVWVGEDRLIVLERIAHTTKLYAIDLGRLPEKRLLMSSDEFIEFGPDIEGVAMLSSSELVIVSDNDFGVEGAGTEFWQIRFDAPLA